MSTRVARGEGPERRLDAAAAVALAGVASAHLQAVGHKLEEAPYVAGLFAALIAVCVALALLLALGRGGGRAWALGCGVSLGALAAYVASRTLGLPQLADHVGHWLDPAALAALPCEAAVVGLWAVRARRAVVRARRASALALPEPAVAWRSLAGAAAAALVAVAGAGATQDALAGGAVAAHAASTDGHGGAGDRRERGGQAVALAAAGHAHDPDAGGEEAPGARHGHGARAGGEEAPGAGHGHGARGGGEEARGAGGAHAHASREDRRSADAGHRHGAPPATSGARAGRAPAAAAPQHASAHHGAAHATRAADHDQLPVGRTGRIGLGRPAALDLAAASERQRAAARRLLDRSHAAARRLFPDAAAARRHGYVASGLDARATFLHFNHAGHARDRRVLDPDRPESLVFWRRPGGALRLVAFMYRARTGRPPDPSPLVRWHVHGSCVGQGARHGRGITVADRRCGPGRVLHHGATMMFHLWLAPDVPSAHALHAPRKLLGARPLRPRPAAPAAPTTPTAPRDDTVVGVLDGDTIVLDRLGEARLAGVDAPAPEACAGAQARDALARLLPAGTAVRVRWEAPRQDADGRALVSVQRGPVQVAAELVRRGLARPDPAPVARHAAGLDALAAEARAAGLGVWATPTCQP